MENKKTVWLKIGVFLLTIPLVMVNIALAAISSCSASVSPTTVATNTTADLTFTVNNTSSSTITWVRFIAPSDHFAVNFGSSSGWSGTRSASTVFTFTGSLAAGNSQTFTVNVTTGNTAADSADWTTRVSETSTGDNSLDCSGSLGVAISSGGGVDSTAPSISNIAVSEVGATSVKISWTTDEAADSKVEYGTSASYGSNKTDSTSTTSHSVTVDGLTANTTYHYKVVSADATGNVAQSSDNTFVTAKESTTTVVVTNTVTNTVTVVASSAPAASSAPVPSIAPTPPPDTSPPTIQISTILDEVFTQPPLIKGLVVDNKQINRVDYSLDDGKNWLPVDNLLFKTQGISQVRTSAEFEFIPAIFEDGNYKLRIRSVDESKNVGLTKSNTIVIDRIPPMVGGMIFSSGPQVLLPNDQGRMFALEGLDQKITLSSVGGATNVDILSGLAGVQGQEASGSGMFSLVKNPDSGLWSGVLAFAKAGEYQLHSRATDGADNQTQKLLNNIVVLSRGSILDEISKPVNNAKVNVYYFEPLSSQFVLWDARPFGQENPQQVDNEGRYKLLLPPGKYYIQVDAPGFKTLKTNIFTLDQALPINANLKMERALGVGWGSLFLNFPDFDQTEVSLKIAYPDLEKPEKDLVQKVVELPYFIFPGTDNQITTNLFRGRPTVISFLATWLPQSSSQIAILEDLQNTNANLNTVVVMTQDSVSKVNIFAQRGGYNLQILADPDGQLAQELGVLNLPTHVFVDRGGVVKSVKVGVLDKNQIRENLVN